MGNFSCLSTLSKEFPVLEHQALHLDFDQIPFEAAICWQPRTLAPLSEHALIREGAEEDTSPAAEPNLLADLRRLARVMLDSRSTKT